MSAERSSWELLLRHGASTKLFPHLPPVLPKTWFRGSRLEDRAAFPLRAEGAHAPRSLTWWFALEYNRTHSRMAGMSAHTVEFGRFLLLHRPGAGQAVQARLKAQVAAGDAALRVTACLPEAAPWASAGRRPRTA